MTPYASSRAASRTKRIVTALSGVLLLVLLGPRLLTTAGPYEWLALAAGSIAGACFWLWSLRHIAYRPVALLITFLVPTLIAARYGVGPQYGLAHLFVFAFLSMVIPPPQLPFSSALRRAGGRQGSRRAKDD